MRRRDMARRALAALLAVAPLLGSSAGAGLAATRLSPDGSYASAPGAPVRFTFAPTADGRRGVSMGGFSLWVRSGARMVVERRVDSAEPVLDVDLTPGRYTWGVQWWDTTGAVSEAARSSVVVAPTADVWDGVPWLGANDTNEYYAEVALPVGDDVEVLIATLGFGYLTINGQDLPTRLTYSDWTETTKKVFYRSYPIASMLNSTGGAAFFVGLGCGYRCDPSGRFPAYQDPGDRSQDTVPKIFRMQVLVDGRRVFDSGSPSWLARQGSVVQDSVYGGETSILAAAQPFRPSVPLPAGWGPRGQMVPATFPGVEDTRVDVPIAIWQPAPGVHVVDFGSNVAGVCSISIPVPATVSLKHGELLQHAHLPDVPSPDPQRVYFGNLRSAEANDTIVNNVSVTNWRPRFTYHGFRYVEVYGYPGNLTNASISRLVMHTAVQERVSANFSDEVLQAIHFGSKGSQRSNMMGVPTDCPQRDERLGWMGDLSLSAESMLLHFDADAMISAFVGSMVDVMGDDGSLPDVVPHQRYGGRPADLSWSSAFLSALYAMWKGGSAAPSKTYWAAVKAHIGNLQAQYQKAGSLKKLPEPYGDWCPPPTAPGASTKERPSPGFAAAFSLIRVLQQAAELGQSAVGTPDAIQDGKAFAALADKLSAEYHQSYYDPQGQKYDNGVMITYVLPLALGAVPSDVKDAVFKNLLAHITAQNGTWTGGIINNRFLFDVLHDNGASGLALSMLQRKTYPSYGYMYFNEFEPARECMWELPDAPFQGSGMNSRNHHMFSSVGHYLLTRVAGLSLMPDGQLRMVVGQLQNSSVRLRLPRGDAAFRWHWANTGLKVEVDVPVGLQARVHVPWIVGRVQVEGEAADYWGSGKVDDDVQLWGTRYAAVTVASGRHVLSTYTSLGGGGALVL